jgi:hypothetical protein
MRCPIQPEDGSVLNAAIHDDRDMALALHHVPANRDAPAFHFTRLHGDISNG